jgi:3-methylcrotonyl-CoA carboxylase alpha subunit
MTTPANSSHIRIDSGVRPGDQVSIFYDPMIAKLVAWGENRDEALRRIRQALLEYKVSLHFLDSLMLFRS